MPNSACVKCEHDISAGRVACGASITRYNNNRQFSVKTLLNLMVLGTYYVNGYYGYDTQGILDGVSRIVYLRVTYLT